MRNYPADSVELICDVYEDMCQVEDVRGAPGCVTVTRKIDTDHTKAGVDKGLDEGTEERGSLAPSVNEKDDRAISGTKAGDGAMARVEGERFGNTEPPRLPRPLSLTGTGQGVNHSRDANRPLMLVEKRPLSWVAIQVAFNELALMADIRRSREGGRAPRPASPDPGRS
jgi:hypothetical protein